MANQPIIKAEDISKAERLLALTAQTDPEGLVAQYDAARIDQDVVNKFIEHHLGRLRASMPDMDPRFEPNFNTYARHALLVGAICGRRLVERET